MAEVAGIFRKWRPVLSDLTGVMWCFRCDRAHDSHQLFRIVNIGSQQASGRQDESINNGVIIVI
jgi:hypothetical protein